MIKWTLELKKIKQLIPYSKNPRYIKDIDFKHLQTSLNKFGMIDKPIINLDNTVIGGHQRINALKKNGVKMVECWLPDRQLDEKEVEELNIRLNKNKGEFDYDVLANEWGLEELLEWGFTEEELQISDPLIENLKEIAKEEESKDKNIICPKCGHEFLK